MSTVIDLFRFRAFWVRSSSNDCVHVYE